MALQCIFLSNSAGLSREVVCMTISFDKWGQYPHVTERSMQGRLWGVCLSEREGSTTTFEVYMSSG